MELKSTENQTQLTRRPRKLRNRLKKNIRCSTERQEDRKYKAKVEKQDQIRRTNISIIGAQGGENVKEEKILMLTIRKPANLKQ